MGSNFEFIISTDDDTSIYYDKLDDKFYKIKKNNIIEINENNHEYKALQYLRQNKKNKSKKCNIMIITAMIILDVILLSAECCYVNDKNKSYVSQVDEYDQDESEIDSILNGVLNSNNNLTEEAKSNIKEYVKMYINRCIDYNVDYTENLEIIINNIRLITDANEYIVKDGNISAYYLDSIFTFTNGKYIAYSLANENDSYGYIANYLYFHDSAMRSVLAGEDIIIGINGKTCTFNLDNIDDEVISYFKEYEETKSEELYLGDFKTNIFSNILESDVYPYTRFYEKSVDEEKYHLKEITSKYYFCLLANKLYSLPDEIDYDDEDTRNIVYLYANALLVNGGVQKNFETTSYIIDSTDDDKSMAAFSRRDLYEYLLGEKLDFTFINCLSKIGLYDDGVGLLTTVDKCLKKDLELGNITDEKYDEFYDAAIAYLTINGGDSLEEFLNAHIHDEIVDDYKLEIIPKRTV